MPLPIHLESAQSGEVQDGCQGKGRPISFVARGQSKKPTSIVVFRCRRAHVKNQSVHEARRVVRYDDGHMEFPFRRVSVTAAVRLTTAAPGDTRRCGGGGGGGVPNVVISQTKNLTTGRKQQGYSRDPTLARDPTIATRCERGQLRTAAPVPRMRRPSRGLPLARRSHLWRWSLQPKRGRGWISRGPQWRRRHRDDVSGPSARSRHPGASHAVTRGPTKEVILSLLRATPTTDAMVLWKLAS